LFVLTDLGSPETRDRVSVCTVLVVCWSRKSS